MHSEESFKQLQTPKERLKAQQLTSRHSLENPSFVIDVTRLEEVIQEHDDLATAITLLSNDRSSDSQLITRLKKRRLQIKKQIAQIARSD
jgi:hypothetical protein